MFLKPIKNFCSLSLQLISFNQDILCLNTTKMKNLSLYVCLPYRPVGSQMVVILPPRDIWHCTFVQGCAIYNTHDSHPNKELSCLKGQQSQVEKP